MHLMGSHPQGAVSPFSQAGALLAARRGVLERPVRTWWAVIDRSRRMSRRRDSGAVIDDESGRRATVSRDGRSAELAAAFLSAYWTGEGGSEADC